MKFIELSYCLKNKIPVFPGDPEFSLKNISKDEEYYISKIKTGLHTATHIDAPLHYIKNGKTVNQINLEELIGKANVLEINKNIKEIKVENIKNTPNTIGKIVILKTEWYHNYKKEKYFYENPYLSNEFAEYLIKNNVKTLALDTCSVDKWEESNIHKKLLKNNINIIENLTNTKKLKKEIYHTEFIPLNICAEASFVRAFAIDNENKTKG